MPGLDGIANASIRQITRDGTRVLLDVGSPGSGGYVLVLETGTGAVLFDSRPMQTAERQFVTATLSPDGAFLAYAAYAAGSTVRIRHLVTGEEQDIFSTATADIRVQAVSDGGALVGAYDPLIPGYASFAVGGAGQPPKRFGATCPTGTFPRLGCTREPLTMTADGTHVAFKRGWFLAVDNIAHYELMVGDVPQQRSRILPITHPELAPEPHPPLPWPDVKMSGDGHWVGFTGRTRGSDEPRAALVHRVTGQTVLVAAALGRTYFHDVSDDARFVLLTGEYSSITGQQVRVVDRLTGLVTPVLDPLDTPAGRYRVLSTHLSGDGSTLVATLGDGGTSDPTPQRTYIARLDADRDGMHDVWEATFGLAPSNAADAVLDPDGDGASSLQEYAAGTHPYGTPVRHFAEGADGAFFATSVALYNPSTTTVTANLRFLGPDGATASRPVTVPAQGPAYVEVSSLGLPFSEFATVVESPVPLVAERRMTWDRSGQYGSHSGTGVASPGPTWHFAEGATIAGLQTFFLLQNPGDTPATVTMRYLLATGVVETRTHVVPARSRATVWVNQEGAPLNAAEFATTVDGSQPIVAERAMYRDAPGEPFAAGSVASGVIAPATTWFFAEGATGPFFDTYLLLSNPATTPVTVSVEYDPAIDPADTSGAATPIARSYTLAPQSRRTIWVAQEAPALASTQVSARLTATAPIVAERTMWWPGPTAASWRENHTEIGATASGLAWGVADIPVDAAAGGWDTFLLVATTEPYLAQVRVDVACSDGTRVSRTPNLLPQRTTLWMRQEFPEIVGKRCGATLTSLEHRVTLSPEVPRRRVPIVVEVASYRGDFAAGGVSLATRLPE
ncbi:hypothetical protein [Luteitalea sp. TBR-22]|uniref:hypothetical protein n=1 Tax=Luteitalea sp. TBR-22 TaxID=2802971 RepID=UPI001EF4486E|nr:hypothetical protein [Luteitalea sp. TBR-22]